jgi:ubiquinol-cytochrome c reductase cytochrome b subunit
MLAIILLGLILVHLILLHEVSSSNPLGIKNLNDKSKFHRAYTFKDLLSFFIMLFFYLFITFFYPNLLSHPDNYIKANPFITPSHIVPE